jgi:hypothetical protein
MISCPGYSVLRIVKIASFFVLPVVFASATLLSCKEQDVTDLAIRHHFNALELQRHDKLIRSLRDLNQSVNSEKLKASAREMLRIGSLHEHYIRDKSRASLVTYADSMYNILGRFHFRNDSIKDQLKTAKEKVMTSGDSTDVLNLFFWAMTAENIVIEAELSQVTVFEDYFTAILPSFLQKELYQVGDTVRVSFQYFPEYDLDFRKVTCMNASSRQTLPYSILKVGPAYILSCVPTASGNYQMDGMVGVGGDFVNGMLISNQFTVR